mmetsp:Transcript_22202/g.68354  ORF Transcript_22202/g.68354 Transcript_22202/m.68354 type:complete len:382 (-) Transcript_22202:7-1152(-)
MPVEEALSEGSRRHSEPGGRKNSVHDAVRHSAGRRGAARDDRRARHASDVSRDSQKNAKESVIGHDVVEGEGEGGSVGEEVGHAELGAVGAVPGVDGGEEVGDGAALGVGGGVEAGGASSALEVVAGDEGGGAADVEDGRERGRGEGGGRESRGRVVEWRGRVGAVAELEGALVLGVGFPFAFPVAVVVPGALGGEFGDVGGFPDQQVLGPFPFDFGGRVARDLVGMFRGELLEAVLDSFRVGPAAAQVVNQILDSLEVRVVLGLRREVLASSIVHRQHPLPRRRVPVHLDVRHRPLVERRPPHGRPAPRTVELRLPPQIPLHASPAEPMPAPHLRRRVRAQPTPVRRLRVLRRIPTAHRTHRLGVVDLHYLSVLSSSDLL